MRALFSFGRHNTKDALLKVVVLVVCLILWGTVSVTTAFFWTLFLVWWTFRLDARIPAGAALLFLVAIPILLSFGQEARAEQIAVYVYFLLVITVVLQIMELWRERPKKEIERSEKVYMPRRYFKKFSIPLFFLLLTVLILWQMLLPGYVITFDMAWTPQIPLRWNADGFNNTFLLRALLSFLSLVIPSWIVQKAVLVSLFFLLFYLPWKFLPWIENNTARVFAACVFVLNPFVYSRMLAGQWMHLLGYALLPFLFYTLVRLVREPRRRTALLFALALSLIALTSAHFLYIGFFFSVLWIGAHLIWKRKRGLVKYAVMGFGIFLCVQLYWIVPALARETPLEARFTPAHFEAFAPVANGLLSVRANVALLGGFWAEDVAWKYYFLWPQAQISFLVAGGMLLLVIGVGIYSSTQNLEKRFAALVLFGIGILAYGAALGAADTSLKSLNMFLYTHVPLWAGLRDSHKIVGVLALIYALFAGLGLESILGILEKKQWKQFASFLEIAVFVVPVFFGIYLWGGFHGQLDPVWYPKEWAEAKAILDAAPPEEKVLVFPWHGYFSLDFAGQHVTSNPAPAFFGYDRIIAGRGVEVEGIYDQETDPAYREIDRLVREFGFYDPKELARALKQHHIGYILVIKNSAIADSREGLVSWIDEKGNFPLPPGETLLEGDSLILRHITYGIESLFLPQSFPQGVF